MGISRRQFIQGTATAGVVLSTSSLGKNRPHTNIVSATELLAPGSIVEASERLRAGSLSVVDLTEHYLACIREVNPQLNAFITIAEDEALESAAALDAELQQGQDRGPLHG
ncbi:MAG: amidase family protein, partial [Phormidesmis sp.]